MNLTRRSFFPAAGVGALSAKAAVDQKIAELAGISTTGHGSSGAFINSVMDGGYGLGSAGAKEVMKGEYLTHAQRLIKASAWLKTFGVPEELEYILREQSKYVSSFDPDIACKRSWSMCVKIAAQRERNYQRALESMMKGGWIEQKRSLLSKLLNFEWPW